MVAILEIVIDSGVSQKVANLLTDKEIEALLQEGKLPDLLTPTDAALAQAVKVALTENASKERNRRQAELAERKRKEDERLAQRSARKRSDLRKRPPREGRPGFLVWVRCSRHRDFRYPSWGPESISRR